MKKRVAKKILQNKDKLHYSPQQIEKAEKKFSSAKLQKEEK